MKSAVCLILLLPLVQAQPTPKADACSPPPGAVPPTLPAKLLEGQGGVHFKITTRSAQAQAFFDQGISQMHSFWVREAERSFLQAAALDPEAPMPHFGIAMVAAGDFRPGFQLDLVNGVNPRKPEPRKEPPAGGEARAIAAAKKALELSQRKGRATDLEKMYIAAAFARRDVTAPDPNIGYVAALRKLIAKYPKEVEARAYLALQIMSGFEMPSKTPRAGTMEAVELLRALLRDAPDHAGVHHYVIHGFEGSTFAKEAWPSCKRYGELANNIPHGLHMPGHIYAQTGRWRDASEAFAAAAHNEIYWMGQDSLAGNGHHGHNVHFLAMALSFQNEFAEAERAARSLLEYKETPREAKQTDNYRTAYRQGWFALMRTLVQHEKWDAILDGTSLPELDRPRERAWRLWATGLAKLARGDRAGAVSAERGMAASLDDLRKVARNNSHRPVEVAHRELRALLKINEGDLDAGLRDLEAAAKEEISLRYNEPTSYPRPIYEVLGQAALKLGKPDLAERAFLAALEQYPESAGAKKGLAMIPDRKSTDAAGR
jgi:tetratricopeptide (TPR) repeat protein